MTDSDGQANTRPPAKACASCARAKVRCTWLRSGPPTASSRTRLSSAICDRCQRLRKTCNPQSQAPRATPIPRTRFGQLERKVDELYQSLYDAESRQQPSKETPAPEIPTSTKREQDNHPNPPSTESYGTQRAENLLTPASLASQQPQATADTLWPGNEEAEALLGTYNTKLSATFPFVVPPNEPAHRLRLTRPFLFKAMVMAASYKNRDIQKQRAHDFAISFTTSIFLEGAKSFDILQGLLVHMAWYQCHSTTNSQMTNLMQLAIAVLADLQLNKPVHANDRRRLIYDGSRNSYGFTSETRTLNNDERRALLCCYYLTSTGSTVYCKVDALEYTGHMDKALAELLASQEREGDILLAHLVHTQKIVHEITQVVPYDEPDRPRARGAPFVMHVKTLDKTLTDFQESLPPSLAKNEFLLMHLTTARVFLYEVSLYDAPWEGTTTRKRLDGLWSCVDSLKSYFDIFCSCCVESYVFLPYALWGQLSHALLTLSRVCLVDIEGWDRSLIEEAMHFSAVISRVMERLQSCQRFAKVNWLGETDDSVLGRVVTKFGWVRAWYEDHVGEGEAYSSSKQTSICQDTASGDFGDLNTMFMENKFWEEIMAEYEALPSVLKGRPELN